MDRQIEFVESKVEVAAFYEVGRMLYDSSDFQRAAEVFRLVALLDPTNGDGWQALGACHEQQGELGVAAVVYETGFHLGGASVELALLAARAFARSNEADKAWELVEQVRGERLTTSERTRVEAVAAELGRVC
jgi:uncharacterized protein HemY